MTKELERRIAELEAEVVDLRSQVQRLEMLRPFEIVPYTIPPVEPSPIPVWTWDDDQIGRAIPSIYPKVTYRCGLGNGKTIKWSPVS